MAFTKINENDYANKGIRTKSNPLNMSVTDAQRAFDELPLDVIIPKVNALSEEIDEYAESTDIKIENLKTRATNSEEALETKVDKEEGKGLSANDYSNEEKQKVAEAYEVKHTHENKDALDGVTAEKVAEWDGKVDAKYVNDTVNEKITELGAADMMQTMYDPQGKQTDIFKYVDDAVDGITAEEVGARPDTWIPTAADVGALPLSGGTLSGNLHINKTFPINKLTNSDNNYSLQLQMAGDKTAGMYNIKDNDNAIGIYLTDTIESPERAVRLSHKYNGTAKYYNVYGEHNITKGTTDLTAGTSTLTTGAIYLVYE